MTIKNDTNKKYQDLKADDYFIGEIKIIELIEKYKLKEKHISRIIDIYKYKTEGYIPQFHSKHELKIGVSYEIRGYMFEDGYLRSVATKELKHESESIN